MPRQQAHSGTAEPLRDLEGHAAPLPARSMKPHSRVSRFCWSIVWLAGVLLLSCPSVLYSIAKSLPEDNTLLPSQWMLQASTWGTSAILALITSYAVPWLSKVTSSSGISLLRTMVVANVLITLILPAVAAVITHVDCFHVWTFWWKPCLNGQFDMLVELFGADRNSQEQILTTEGMCDARPGPGRCARGVVDLLHLLLLKKLALQASVLPLLDICLAATHGRLPCQRQRSPEEEVEKNATRGANLTSRILVNLLIAMVLGAAVPLLVPFATAAMLATLAAHTFAVTKFKAAAMAEPNMDALVTSLGVASVAQAIINGLAYIDIGLPIQAAVLVAWSLALNFGVWLYLRLTMHISDSNEQSNLKLSHLPSPIWSGD